MIRTLSLLYAAALLAVSVTAAAQPAPSVRTAGGTLATTAGMTLYVFDRDASGKSACNGPCAVNWPPLAAAGNATAAGDWTIVVRDDGSRQWAFKGKPLYTCAKDRNAGDKAGDGLNNLWHVAKG